MGNKQSNDADIELESKKGKIELERYKLRIKSIQRLFKQLVLKKIIIKLRFLY